MVVWQQRPSNHWSLRATLEGQNRPPRGGPSPNVPGDPPVGRDVQRGHRSVGRSWMVLIYNPLRAPDLTHVTHVTVNPTDGDWVNRICE